MDSVESLPKKYEREFDPMAYLTTYCSTVGGSLADGDIFTWYFDSFHDIFQSGMIKGSRMLDIGTGPNLYTLISAVPHCGSITLSDFTQQNRLFLKQWLDGSSPFDFSHFFKYIVEKEGKGESYEVRDRQLKEKITAILAMDLLKNQPFSPCYLPKFPVITSSLCFEAVSTEYTEYKKIAARVTSLLETGGHLVLCGVMNQKIYTFGGVAFETCSLSSQQIKDAWTGCRMKIVVWKEDPLEGNEEADYAGIFTMCAEKLP